MMSRAAEKNLRAIQRDNLTAALMFSVIREHMQIGTNALTISQAALCKILGSSRTTIYRASKYLAENNYVQLIKTGNVTTYVVNEQVAFAGSAGQRKAVFSTTLVAHECEQDEGWAEVRKLKSVPIIYGDERIVLGCDELPSRSTGSRFMKIDIILNHKNFSQKLRGCSSLLKATRSI